MIKIIFAVDFGLVPEEKADQGLFGGRHGVSVPDCSQTCEAEHAWLGYREVISGDEKLEIEQVNV